jgi:hypothetical protein
MTQKEEQESYSLQHVRKLRPEEYEDDADFAARFAFSPSLERLGYDKDKYKHINKNLVLTHLSNQEVTKAQLLLRAIQVLVNHNKTEYYLPVQNSQGTHLKQITKSIAKEYNRQGYAVFTKTKNRWQDILDIKTGELFGMTSTASGAGASLLKEWRQQRVKQEQTIREEQEPTNWFGRIRRNTNDRRKR